VKLNPSLEYQTVYGDSEKILNYVIRQLKNELVDRPFLGNLKEEFLDRIFENKQ